MNMCGIVDFDVASVKVVSRVTEPHEARNTVAEHVYCRDIDRGEEHGKSETVNGNAKCCNAYQHAAGKVISNNTSCICALYSLYRGRLLTQTTLGAINRARCGQR